MAHSNLNIMLVKPFLSTVIIIRKSVLVYVDVSTLIYTCQQGIYVYLIHTSLLSHPGLHKYQV